LRKIAIYGWALPKPFSHAELVARLNTPYEMISLEAMISKADKYLYQAKREGR
jgi:hypothetical protein